MQRAIDTCRLKVDIIDTVDIVVNIDFHPHGTIVRLLEVNVLLIDDWITAIDDHIVIAKGRVGEVVLVGVRVLLVAAEIVVLLETDDIHFLSLHLREDVQSDETGCLS